MTVTGIEYDGLVVEGPNGVRLLAIPTQTLEILRFAEVIQYKNGDRVSRMRVANFLQPREMRTQEQATQDHVQEVREAEQEIREQAANSAAVAASWAAGSAAANGSDPLPDPSPTPPPATEQEEQEAEPDPANIPLRTRRDGEWVTVYVTREQYERYQAQGRILAQAPDETEPQEGGTDDH